MKNVIWSGREAVGGYVLGRIENEKENWPLTIANNEIHVMNSKLGWQAFLA